jgi:hypothetical protein
MVARAAHDVLERVAEAALAALLVIGSGFLWVGIPWLGFWLAGELTTTAEGFLFAVLAGVPLAMIVYGWLLYRVNDVYVGMRGGDHDAGVSRATWLIASSDERRKLQRAKRPKTLIDVAMTGSAVTAMVLLVVWFLFFAHMNPVTPV